MLDIQSAKVVMNSINKEIRAEIVTLEDVCNMQPIQRHTKGGYTILVWVQFNKKLGICVRRVKTQAW